MSPALIPRRSRRDLPLPIGKEGSLMGGMLSGGMGLVMTIAMAAMMAAMAGGVAWMAVKRIRARRRSRISR
jgi:hypothetical protein